MKKSITTVALAFALNGCATFTGSLPPAQDVYVKPTPIYVSMSFEQTLNGEQIINGAIAMRNDLLHSLVISLEKSGYKIEPNRAAAKEFLEVNFKSTGSYSWTASTLSGLTLFIIPSVATDYFNISAEYSDGKEKRTIEVSDTSRTWTSIALIPILPFADSQTAQSKTINNMFKTLIFDINNQ